MLWKSQIAKKLKIDYPIIQGGMVWVSGARLAAAASNAGCLGVIGAGSMKPELLNEHIKKAQALTERPLAVNLPILYSESQEQLDCALKLGIKIFITSAGSPKKYTEYLKEKGCFVMHVTSSPELAKKCEDAGVDAIIAEGFEAGGHNGRDEITTMALVPQVCDMVKLPVIAAGGIADARTIMAARCLGADAVQMGTRFLMTQESSAHENYKNLLLKATPGATKLSMKELVPVRLYKNDFYRSVEALEKNGASREDLALLLGKGRAKRGMLEGDIEQGELEVGQICSLIQDLPRVEEMIKKIVKEFEQKKKMALSE